MIIFLKIGVWAGNKPLCELFCIYIAFQASYFFVVSILLCTDPSSL